MTRSLTLLAAVGVFVLGTITGLRMLVSGTEAAEPAATCERSVVKAGEQLASNAVRVNVFNASNRSGLANRATIDLQSNGFLGGEIGNSTSATTTRRVTILTPNRRDPRVRLVAAQFRDKVAYATNDIGTKSGVTVIVGSDYSGVKSKTRTTITTDRDITICVPVVSLP